MSPLPSTPQSHYDHLKVARDAPAEVIRAAYKALAQKYHPDKWPAAQQAEATRAMQQIAASHAVLTDPVQRAAHDAWIQAQAAQVQGAQTQATSAPPAPARQAPPPPEQAVARQPPAAPPAPARQGRRPGPWLATAALLLAAGGAAVHLGSARVPPGGTHATAATAPPPTHHQQVAAAHPDAREVIASRAFVDWSRRLGPARQAEFTRILHSGTAQELIALLSEYKQQAQRP